MNYKNQVDCIIDPVCSLFSDRGVWEAAFTITYTNTKLQEPTYLNKKKPGLGEFYFLQINLLFVWFFLT